MSGASPAVISRLLGQPAYPLGPALCLDRRPGIRGCCRTDRLLTRPPYGRRTPPARRYAITGPCSEATAAATSGFEQGRRWRPDPRSPTEMGDRKDMLIGHNRGRQRGEEADWRTQLPASTGCGAVPMSRRSQRAVHASSFLYYMGQGRRMPIRFRLPPQQRWHREPPRGAGCPWAGASCVLASGEALPCALRHDDEPTPQSQDTVPHAHG